MKKVMISGVALAAALSVSGCGGLGVALEAVDRAEELSNLQTANAARAVATADEVAARTGTATYTGQSVFGGARSDTQNVGFNGDTELNVDFDAATVAGEVTSIIGSDLSDAELESIENGTADLQTLLSVAQNAQGTVDLAGTVAAGAVDVDATGDLTMDNVAYNVSGGVIGTFKGSGLEGVTMAEDADFVITRDGTALSGSSFEGELQE